MKKILLFLLISISLWSCSSSTIEEDEYFAQFDNSDWYKQEFGSIRQIVDIEGIKCKQLLFSEDVNIFWNKIPYCIQTDSILYWYK